MTVQAPPPAKHMVLDQMRTIIETVDEHARALNRRWGYNRLPHLVPIEWAERFKAQRDKWQAACFECAGSLLPADIDRVRKHGEAMLRAYDALERVAGESGHAPSQPWQKEFELRDGTPVVLVQDRADIGQVETSGRAVQIWSLQEVADIVAKFPEIVRAKEAFPGAEVIQMATGAAVIDKLDDELGDLPF